MLAMRIDKSKFCRAEDTRLWTYAMRTVQRFGEPRPAPAAPVVQLKEKAITGNTLDLHGRTLEDAHRKTTDLIAVMAEVPVTVITGRSGSIRAEFAHWLANHPTVRVEELNGGGAFRLHKRRKRR
jgi:dsDNA-specific endonuclease/ATPase MutS2